MGDVISLCEYRLDKQDVILFSDLQREGKVVTAEYLLANMDRIILDELNIEESQDDQRTKPTGATHDQRVITQDIPEG